MTTKNDMRVAVIGCGNMGGALLKGWARANASETLSSTQSPLTSSLPPLALTATARTQRTLDAFHAACPAVRTTLSNAEAVSDADVVVLAVKPWFIAEVIDEIRDTLAASERRPVLVSVAANITSADLQALLGLDLPCVYVMPNIAAEFGASMTFVEGAMSADSTAARQKEAVAVTEALFSLVGSVQVVPSRLMAPGMMMAGCGIAYVMRYLRAMMEGGVEMGFYPADARKIALQTMEGAVRLLEETGLHPEVAIDKVTTPGGITIRGLNELDHAAFNSAVIRSLKAGL
ncbi:MAG: pyrroline-5-carboxylate reductase [Bacteroidales bacterium]|nr:pyrroline-5-carboxylate reductase [Bacteroidales bacterium]